MLSAAPLHRVLPHEADALCGVAKWDFVSVMYLCCMSCVSLVEYIAQYKAYIMEFLQTWNTDCFTYRHIFMYRQTCMERKYASSIQIYLWVCHLVWHFIIGYCECEACRALRGVLCMWYVLHIHRNRTMMCTRAGGEK